jgi:ribosomal protein S18 acetylase RimI-like enzyme
MDTMTIRLVDHAQDPVLAQVTTLFEEMHREMAGQGMGLSLAEGGAALWCNGMARGLERFGRLVVAERGGELVGFAHGALKLAPEHLGGVRLGHISHVHVVRDARGSGVGRAMVELLHAWFQEREVASIELQVLAGNEAGQAFWRALGYRVELLQLRKG